ncbi:UDP-N-acetylmuramoyl-L-alanyl-D-glutamate--2,6-diaminopimelate ligase [soil metagenome]
MCFSSLILRISARLVYKLTCFGNISVLFLGCCGAGDGCPSLATLRSVNLDAATVGEILGVRVPSEVQVSGVTHDSREVRPGFAFVAVPGFRRDGAEFAAEASERGASLVLAEKDLQLSPSVIVPDARVALADLACAVYGNPSEKLEIFGVTGTNGKTTTAYALHAILSHTYGTEACGLMTTAETICAGTRRPAGRTTPEAPEVQETLAEMVENGVKKVVMEVSSHGIALRRIAGTRFSGALFTNLSRDHLDLHGTMEAYYETKRQLFHLANGPKLANADDEWGVRLAREVEGVGTFGESKEADYRVEEVRSGPQSTFFALRHNGGLLETESPLLGGYNLLNVAGAAALALEIGVVEASVGRAVRQMPQVPGRFERIESNREFEIIVDYAHTDVGLAAVLEVARNVAGRARADGPAGRVICVFGAAGDRDGAKRPLMGKVAADLADWSIITTDDAYSEEPGRIAREVSAGADPGSSEIVLDRREAIRKALCRAEPGDVIVVAGKGHERVQHLPHGAVTFHDASVVCELLNELGKEDR